MAIKLENPFITGTEIPSGLFCERDKETQQILDLLKNGNNVVLKSKRRIGKSSLIAHILNLPEIKQKYNTFYLDIYGTKNADEFNLLFQTALMKEPWASRTKVKKTFASMLKGIQVSFGSYDGLTGVYNLPSIGLSPNEIPRIPISDLFAVMEESSKPCIAVFDEFQQIQKYPESFAAVIRSQVQKMNNTKFIFSGSSKHMLATMFNDYGQPFYKSARSVDLDTIPLEIYTDFCHRLFNNYGKNINSESVRFIYELFSGETLLMQQTMNDVFAKTQKNETADKKKCTESVIALLRSKDTDFKEILNRLDNLKERNTLIYIAYQGIAEKPTSVQTIKRFNLQGPAQVQNALNNLGEEHEDLIEKIGRGQYVIKDRLLELWLAERMDILQEKFDKAEDRYITQRNIENELPEFNIKSETKKKTTNKKNNNPNLSCK